MISKKVLANRILVGVGVAIVMVGMVLIAAFSAGMDTLVDRSIDSVIISALILMAVVEMRRALGRERIPDSFSWLLWAYGFGLGPAYAFFGFTGLTFFTLMIFAGSAITAVYTNNARALMYVAFMLVYPGMFLASLLYINKCVSTRYITPDSALYPYIVNDIWTLIGDKRVAQLLPYNAIGLAFVFAVSAFTDVFAFIFGISFGKHKLCPEISPKKTVEGAIGGLFGGLVGSAVVFFVFDFFKLFGPQCGLTFHDLSTFNLVLVYVLIGLIGSVMTQLGDLVASMVKRYCGIKDYSHVLGSHGGIMDRLDGVMFNSVFVATVYMFIL